MDEVDYINKEAVKTDFKLIKACLRLVNQTIILTKQRGETFTASENLELHKLISKIDKDLNRIKVNINYETNNTMNHQTRYFTASRVFFFCSIILIIKEESGTIWRIGILEVIINGKMGI